MTSIEWTDKSWNPVVGCRRVSPGCEKCYAERLSATRLKNLPAYKGLNDSRTWRWTGKVRTLPDRLNQPLHWRKPRKIFVCDMGDLFHEDVPDEFIDRVFAVMALASHHTFQVLTKRADRMLAYLAEPARIGSGGLVWYAAEKARPSPPPRHWYHAPRPWTWPLPNVWLGVSVEDQERADERIPLLLQTPAAVRFISAEPLLEPADLSSWLRCEGCGYTGADIEIHGDHRLCKGPTNILDWVIVGGESGPGARPCNIEWIRSIHRQCKEARVPVFIKQMGRFPYETRPAEGRKPGVDRALAHLGKTHPQRAWFQDWTLVHKGGESGWYRYPRLKSSKGGDMSEWPEDLRVREFPQGSA